MDQEAIHVLLVEDNPDHVELIQRVLKRQPSVASVTAVTRGIECLEMLSQNAYSVVLLDYSLPEMNGLAVLKEIRRRGHDLPVVMVTSQGVERVAAEAMQEGASDYVVKAAGYLTTLPPMLSKVLKQHELQMENVRLLEETRTRAQEQGALNAVAVAVSQSLRIDELLKIALNRVLDVTGRERGCIRLKDPTTGTITLGAHQGLSEQYIERLVRGRIPGGKCDQVFQSGELLVVNNPAEARLREAVLREGIQAIVWVPLRAHGKVVGILNVSTCQKVPFAPREVELLQSIGNVIGVAVENARLYEETERRRREAEELGRVSRTLTESLAVSAVGQRIVESVLPLFAAQDAVVWLVQPEGSMVVLASTGPAWDLLARGYVFPPGVGLAARVVAEGRPVWSSDILSQADIFVPDDLRRRLADSGVTAVLAVPLRAKGKIIGALVVGDRAGRAFSKDEVALLEAFAAQGGLALENARLYEESRRRSEKLEALARLTRLMTAATEPQEVFDFVTRSAVQLFNANNAHLWLRDPAQPDELVVRSRFGVDEAKAPTYLRVKIGRGVIGQIAAAGKPEFVTDVTKDPRWLRPENAVTLGRSFFGLPLVLGEKVVGGLAIFTDWPRPFGPEEWDLLKIFADQVSITLESARLFDEARRSYEDLRQAQEHLVRSERLRALGEMAGGVAHDFNNLLAVILGRAQYLKMAMDDLDPEAVNRSLELIEQSARRGAETVRHLFEFTRDAAGTVVGPVDINEVVKGAVAASEPRWKDEVEAEGITIEVKTDLRATRAALGSAEQLREALLSLIFNAVEAMPEGGQLTLETWDAEDEVGLRVADTGIGMGEEAKMRAFEPFFTTKGPQRTGLGLSTAYGIISRHHGTITVRASEGKGTELLIRLPSATAPEVESATSVPPSTVLVIDDEEGVREMLADILSTSGHTVVMAASGPEGLEYVERQSFDLVCTDLGMPGMAGWQVIDAVRALRPDTPVALITGWGVQVRPEEMAAHHADFLLTKPFEISDVLAMLAEARARRPGAGVAGGK